MWVIRSMVRVLFVRPSTMQHLWWSICDCAASVKVLFSTKVAEFFVENDGCQIGGKQANSWTWQKDFQKSTWPAKNLSAFCWVWHALVANFAVLMTISLVTNFECGVWQPKHCENNVTVTVTFVQLCWFGCCRSWLVQQWPIGILKLQLKHNWVIVKSHKSLVWFGLVWVELSWVQVSWVELIGEWPFLHWFVSQQWEIHFLFANSAQLKNLGNCVSDCSFGLIWNVCTKKNIPFVRSVLCFFLLLNFGQNFDQQSWQFTKPHAKNGRIVNLRSTSVDQCFWSFSNCLWVTQCWTLCGPNFEQDSLPHNLQLNFWGSSLTRVTQSAWFFHILINQKNLEMGNKTRGDPMPHFDATVATLTIRRNDESGLVLRTHSFIWLSCILAISTTNSHPHKWVFLHSLVSTRCIYLNLEPTIENKIDE